MGYILVRMKSAAETGYCFNIRRLRLQEKLVLLRYDPIVRGTFHSLAELQSTVPQPAAEAGGNRRGPGLDVRVLPQWQVEQEQPVLLGNSNGSQTRPLNFKQKNFNEFAKPPKKHNWPEDGMFRATAAADATTQDHRVVHHTDHPLHLKYNFDLMQKERNYGNSSSLKINSLQTADQSSSRQHVRTSPRSHSLLSKYYLQG
ncbi:hypothetical protein QYF61_007162 [Mycteria americana]|uniref:39S ribosomal protein L33, mitochondrial n=1 Tax=Mycteria americana TaxID=33587 RepID=A0AAN7N958_MYCAM|nr:hypothetical protein QYF61_007162 [Mycteria americana]